MMNVPEDWPLEEYKDLVSQKYFHEWALFHSG
jgi:hypothetical protein